MVLYNNMTPKQIKNALARAYKIWDLLRERLDRLELDLVSEYVDLQIELEAENNK